MQNVYVCVYVWSICACEDQGFTLGVFLYYSYYSLPNFCSDRCSLILELSDWLDWLASEPLGFSFLRLPVLILQICTAMLSFLMWMLGMQKQVLVLIEYLVLWIMMFVKG